MLLSNSMTWKLSQMVVSGKNSIMSSENYTASLRNPLDLKFTSPGSSKRYDNDGIGLGIVAALDKSGNGINPISYFDSISNESDPVHYCRRFQFVPEIDLSDSEEYTSVTTRDGVTKVYYNDLEFETCQKRLESVHRDRRRKQSVKISEESQAKKRDVNKGYPDFLTSCCLCKKKLQGQDIYIYKGDEGYCSKVCRSAKIMEDNLKVQHKSSNVEFLSSPSAGIFLI